MNSRTRRLASLTLAVVALGAFAGAASAAPGQTTHNITMDAAFDGVVELPALNNEFTSMTIDVNDGTANWGPEELDYWTSYTDGVMNQGVVSKTGIYYDAATDTHYGPLLLEGTQVGAVIYSIDGGLTWAAVTPDTEFEFSEGTRHVQVAYNDRPGSYDDNFGSLSLKVVRTKA